MFLTDPFLFRKTLRLQAAGAAFALAPKPVQVRKSYRLQALPAALAATGKSVMLKRSLKITVPVRTFAIAPQPSALKISKRIAAAPASLAVTPRSVTLIKSRVAGFVKTDYAIAGQPVKLLKKYLLRAGASSFAIGAGTVGLSKVAGQVAVLPAAFVIAAKAATLRTSRFLKAQPAQLIPASPAVQLSRGYPLIANPASLVIAGQASLLKAARRIVAVTGDWNFSQPSVNLNVQRNPVVTYRSAPTSTADASSYTYNSVAVGTAATLVVVAVYTTTASANVSSVTIDGVAATPHVNPTTGDPNVAIFSRAFTPTGPVSIVVNCSASNSRNGIGVWTIDNLLSTTPVDSSFSADGSNTSKSVTLNVQNRGVTIVGAGQSFAAVTPTNYTERFDNSIESTDNYEGGDDLVAATGTRTYTAANCRCISAVHWR